MASQLVSRALTAVKQSLASRVVTPDTSVLGQQLRCFAYFKRFDYGFPPQKSNRKYKGIHCPPGRVFGYPNPRKRQGTGNPLPNRKLQADEFHLSTGATGNFYWRPPYPPRINRTIAPDPPADTKRNLWPTKVHKKYPLRWKNVEYEYEPQMLRKPIANRSERWSGPVHRIEHHGKGKSTKTLVTHDARLLQW
eukprot:TRINITY_DN58545_c0_g1_i1.p2 TRINITY_DN58545_c0_g1~~TRINITY_DN58545_c0_g1_i1.p2  ORF type:complete len:193 (-),score=24.09 TRINITY_DN58545_c0_g1_i1:111-689(-)